NDDERSTRMAATKQSRRTEKPPPDNPDTAPDRDGTPPPGPDPQPTTTSPSKPDHAEKKLPAFKVGPIPTDRNNAVSCAVWENEVAASDGRTFKVHNVTVEASYRDADGHWKSAKGFRGSQLYALLYCVQKASD